MFSDTGCGINVAFYNFALNHACLICCSRKVLNGANLFGSINFLQSRDGSADFGFDLSQTSFLLCLCQI